MNLAAFYHSGMYPEIYAPDRFHLRFSFRAASGDIETCTLVYFHKNHREETTKEERMSEQYHLGTSVVYTAVVSFQKPARYLQYYFRVFFQDKKLFVTDSVVNQLLRRKMVSPLIRISGFLHKRAGVRID